MMNTPDASQRAHILIIEDSLGVARALNRTLSLPQGGGYWVETCESGEAALERLRRARFDLLITDLRLPGMNGLALLEHARQISPETRSVLITAFGSPQVEERARHLANAYLPKPFRLHNLIQIVHRILGEPAAQKQLFPESDTKRQRAPGAVTAIDRRKATYLKILACDLDGTIAERGQIPPKTWESLFQPLRDTSSLSIILVTSSTLENYTAGMDRPGTDGAPVSPMVPCCRAIVAENGAVVYFPQRDVVTMPFGRLPPVVLQRLENLDVPLERGKAIVTTRKPHDEAILKLLEQMDDGITVEYNQHAAMVLPPGVTKGTGLRYALEQLGYSPRNVVACGDAENDLSLFEVSELAVATSDAPAEIQALADAVLSQAGEVGVRTLTADLLDGRVPNHLPRPNRRLLLGRRTSGISVHVDPFALVNGNMGMFGISGGNEQWNKFWLASSLAKALSRQGYQICVIDSRGSYRSLGVETVPNSQLLGRPATELPPVADVVSFCQDHHANLILDLSTYTQVERITYVRELLPALQDLRTRLGRPHWFLIEDVHGLCPPTGGQLTDLLLASLRKGGFGLASDRPSHMALDLLEALDYWVVTHLDQPEEIAALRPFLTKHAGGPAALSQLPSLPIGQAYICLGDVEEPGLSMRGFIKLQVET
jgi:hydroxymethylpyrimidine pyrophosphatase-like HAD family hydrolase/CheY-like chemotaxis protein